MSDAANGGTKQVTGSQVVVTLDYETRRIHLGGKTANLLEAIMMLEAALREADYMWRNERAAEQLNSPALDISVFSRRGLRA